MIRLIIREENKEPREFTIDKFPVTIGRAKDNTIKISNPFLSREHCKIEETKKGLRIIDLDSKNGISVNGQTVKASDLIAGDMITIGNDSITIAKPDDRQEYTPAPPPSAEADSEIKAQAIDDSVWNKQLEQEEITECNNCGTLFSVSYRIPGVGIFCPKCKESYAE